MRESRDLRNFDQPTAFVQLYAGSQRDCQCLAIRDMDAGSGEEVGDGNSKSLTVEELTTKLVELQTRLGLVGQKCRTVLKMGSMVTCFNCGRKDAEDCATEMEERKLR